MYATMVVGAETVTVTVFAGSTPDSERLVEAEFPSAGTLDDILTMKRVIGDAPVYSLCVLVPGEIVSSTAVEECENLLWAHRHPGALLREHFFPSGGFIIINTALAMARYGYPNDPTLTALHLASH